VRLLCESDDESFDDIDDDWGGDYEISDVRLCSGANIGIDFGGAARARAPPIIEKCLCFYQLLPPFSPNILACPSPIFFTIYASGCQDRPMTTATAPPMAFK